MKRERIERKAPGPRRSVQILPLDPRDPDVVRAKALEDRVIRREPRGRHAA